MVFCCTYASRPKPNRKENIRHRMGTARCPADVIAATQPSRFIAFLTPIEAYMQRLAKGARPRGHSENDALECRSFARRRVRIDSFLRLLPVQARILDQELAYIQEANRVVFEGRARGIVAEIDIRALINRIENAQAPRLIAPIQIGDVNRIQI